MSASKTVLNKTQLEILKLFSKPLSDEELQEIKKVLVNHLSQKLSKKINDISNKKGYTAEDFSNWLNDPAQ